MTEISASLQPAPVIVAPPPAPPAAAKPNDMAVRREDDAASTRAKTIACACSCLSSFCGAIARGGCCKHYQHDLVDKDD